MFDLFALDKFVDEQPIAIDFTQWLKTRNTPAEHMPSLPVTITIVRTEWEGLDDPDGKRPWECAADVLFAYGVNRYADTSQFAGALQAFDPIPKVGVNNDVNHWFNLLNFAMAEAIDWRRAKAGH